MHERRDASWTAWGTPAVTVRDAVTGFILRVEHEGGVDGPDAHGRFAERPRRKPADGEKRRRRSSTPVRQRVYAARRQTRFARRLGFVA